MFINNCKFKFGVNRPLTIRRSAFAFLLVLGPDGNHRCVWCCRLQSEIVAKQHGSVAPGLAREPDERLERLPERAGIQGRGAQEGGRRCPLQGPFAS